MFVKRIELKDFRNYKDLDVSFNKNVNIFIGNNAQGKTNLLESIYLNSMARSFKTSKDKELIRFGSDFCRMRTTAFFDDDEHTTEIVITKDGKKGIKLDGVRIKKTSELLERIFIIIFSPEDMKIVKDEPEKRRKFIDMELCQIKPGYYSDLSNYKRVLRQRNVYLKESAIDISILDIWDHELARYGAKVISRRDEFILKINDISKEIHGSISGGKETLNVKYEANVEKSADPADTESVFYEKLLKTRDDDIRNRTTV